jgi:hypothetical protein
MLAAGELIEYEIYGLTVGDTFDAREVHPGYLTERAWYLRTS